MTGSSADTLVPEGARADQFDVMVAVGCNARCAFCVQEATFKPAHADDAPFFHALRRHMADFHAQGGRRVIITGGEPLLVLERVLAVLDELNRYPDLEVKALYTNGARLLDPLGADKAHTVTTALAEAGLGCLNLSVHHYDDVENRRIFMLPRRPSTPEIAHHAQSCGLPFRLNLTLQKGGIDTAEALVRYVRWGFDLGAKAIYVRELFRFGFDSSLSNSDRRPIDYSRTHAVSARGIVEHLLRSPDYRLRGERTEALRKKTEWEFEFLPAQAPVFLSSLEVGTEAASGYPYVVLMPDAKLYRGWLGEVHQIAGLSATSHVR